MNTRQFVVACLKEAFHGGWALANTIASVLALAGGLVAWQWAQFGGGINFLMWALPLSALVVSIYFGSLLAAHRLYQKQTAQMSQQAAHVAQLMLQQNDRHAEAEKEHRQTLYARLRQEYLLSHDGHSAAMMAGLEQIPKEWVNKRLAEMGENWRV